MKELFQTHRGWDEAYQVLLLEELVDADEDSARELNATLSEVRSRYLEEGGNKTLIRKSEFANYMGSAQVKTAGVEIDPVIS